MDPDRKKREPPDPEGQPQLKKHASTPAMTEDADPKDVPVLLYQNKAMQIRIKEMRMEIQSFEEAGRKYREKKRLHDETISCATRTWDQMNDCLQKLLSRLDLSYEHVTPQESEGRALVHLLLQSPEPLYDVTEFDEPLQKRIEKTQQIASRIIEAVEKEHASCGRVTEMLRDSHQISAASREQIQKLEAENKHLTSTLNKLQATQHQTTTKASHLENQNRMYSEQIEDLQVKIEQLEGEVSTLRRKIIKQEIPLPVGVIAQPRTTTTTTTTSANTATPPPNTPTTNTNTNGTTQKIKEEDGKQNGQLGQELSDWMALAESRKEEAAKLQSEKVSLLRELTKLRDEVAHPPAERVNGSETYKRLERELRAVRDNLEREKETIGRLKSEMSQLREHRRKDREAIEKEESNKRRVLDSQFRELQDLVTKLKVENSELQTSVEQRLASLPSEKYISELKLLLTTRDADVKKLREECERLTIANKHLNERRGDKAEELLQTKQIEINDLHDKIKKLERDLDDFARKEKSWQSRERDFRNALDSYQLGSKDRRDIHDLRVQERRLRDDLDDLRREKDDLRRMYEKSQRAEAMKDTEKKYQDEIKALKAEHDKAAAKFNYQIKELKLQLESKTQEYDIMMGEVDNMGKCYEDMQSQNRRILLELGQKEDDFTKVASEGMRMKRQVTTAEIQVREMQDRWARAEERCKGYQTTIEELEQQVNQAHMKFSKAFDELQGTGLGMDTLRREARDAQMQTVDLKQQLEGLEKVSTEARRKVEDMVEDLEKEREKVRRLEEDKSSLKRKLDRLPKGGSSSGGFNLAEEELRSIKQKITCGVCNDRPKDTVISKCFHVFCHECVATNLQIRKRRCPSCQAPFSNNDVHSLYGYV